MHRTLATLVGSLGLALMSSTAMAQDVSYDYDKAADFSRLKTYAWVPGTNLRDELNHKRIMDAVDAQLVRKGLTRVDSPNQADVLVSYHTAFGTELQINGYGTGWGPRYRRTGSARVEEITIGTLAIVMMDGKSRDVLWRGITSKELDLDASPEKRDKNINKAAEKLFRKYPPQA
jgi:Domain of unknown function (DUF4136)